MKVVILAGGYGTRISEETQDKPKPLIAVGGNPILWHIMKLYSQFGFNDFIICLGYKGHLIKEYFANYHLHMQDLTIDLQANHIHVHHDRTEPWKVTLVNTGEDTMTGGRLKRLVPYLKDEDAFCMTYGDGVADVDLGALVTFHKEHGKLATLTAVQPPERFGFVQLEDGNVVTSFLEKPNDGRTFINGGFFVLSPKVLDYIDNDHTIWERKPLETLAQERQLCAYKHQGFWHCLDTLRDKNKLEELWATGSAPWKTWD